MPSSRPTAFSPRTTSPKSISSRPIFDGDYEEWKTCRCPARSPLRTAWTTENAGRRFWSCPNFINGGCNFFMWKDIDPFPSQARHALSILLEENSTLKRRVSELEGKLGGNRTDEGDKEMQILRRERGVLEKELILSNIAEAVRRKEEKLTRKVMFLFMGLLIVGIAVCVRFSR